MEKPEGKKGVLDACCVGPGEESGRETPGSLSGWQKKARARAGVGMLALAGVSGYAACAVQSWSTPLWILSAIAAWFGLSHLVAALTGYRGCPELGAIPSLLLRRHVATRCAPWERIDQRIEPRQ